MQLLIAPSPPSACRVRSPDFFLREGVCGSLILFGRGEEMDLTVLAGAVSSFGCLKCSSLWIHQQETWVNMSLSADGRVCTMYATS